MTDQEWTAWSTHHKTLFALRADADAEMIALWRHSLGHCSAADLTQASSDLLARGGKYKAEHVAELLKIVSERARARAVAWESRDRSFACAVCSDRGLVDVPSPACIADGNLIEGNFGGMHYYATIVVYCNCSKGGFKHQRQGEAQDERKRPRKMPGTIVAYERDVCPHWKVLMEELAMIRKAKYEVARLASYRPLAREIGKITRKVAS